MGGDRGRAVTRRRLTLVGGCLLAASWPTAQFLRGYVDEATVLHPYVGPVALPDDAVAASLVPIIVPTASGTLHGWFAAPRGGGTVVLCHGTSATRASLWLEARALLAAGHGVVMFDWPGHGESDGAVQIGQPALAAMRAMLVATTHLPGVDSLRIGVLGFSLGGVAAARATATGPRVRALALIATPVDLVVQTREAYRPASRFAARGALWFWKRHGDPLGALTLFDVAPRLAPRSVLIVGSAADRAVRASDATTLARLVGPSAELWVLPRGEHGHYADADATYLVRVADFFTRALGAIAAPASSSVRDNRVRWRGAHVEGTAQRFALPRLWVASVSWAS